jgi:hypothetical protein
MMPEPERTTPPKSRPGLLPLIVVAIVILAAVGGIFAYNEYMKPELVPGEVSIALSIDYGNGTVEWHNITTTNNSMTGALAAAIGSANFNVNKSVEGVLFMESVKGVRNNGTIGGMPDAQSRWWQYSINGTAAPLTNLTFESRHALAPLKDCQRIDFKFIPAFGPIGIIDKSGITVTVKLNYGNETTIEETIVTDNYTALGALEEIVGYENLAMTDYGAWGFIVDGINDVTTGATVDGISDTSNYYWLWYVNDDFAMVGASQYVLQDGDVMEWRFEESIW